MSLRSTKSDVSEEHHLVVIFQTFLVDSLASLLRWDMSYEQLK